MVAGRRRPRWLWIRETVRTGLWMVAVCVALSAGSVPAPAAAQSQPHALGPAASASPELAVTFEESAVVAEELTPDGDAVFFSVAREPQGFYTRVARRRSVEIVDPFGEARFDLEGEPESGEVPLKSVWAVVDLETGAYAVAAPHRFRLRRVPFRGEAFEVGAPGLVNRLRHAFSFVDVLLVRPGEGAWWLQSWDTAPSDRDGVDDGRTVTAIGDMESLAASSTSPLPPAQFAEGDVLVVIHPRDLRFAATRLIGPPETGGSS